MNMVIGRTLAVLILGGSFITALRAQEETAEPFDESQAADRDWSIPQAAWRFRVEITKKPSTSTAGVLIRLHDHGFLPEYARCEAFADGQPVTTRVLWHNPDEGLMAVFQTPHTTNPSDIWVYLVDDPTPHVENIVRVRNLRPGLLLYTVEGVDSLDAAGELRTGGVLARRHTRCEQVSQVCHNENPWGDSSKYISFYFGWMRTARGDYFVSSVSGNESELYIDGVRLADVPARPDERRMRLGEYGQLAYLGNSTHYIEYLHAFREGRPEAQACWHAPGMDRNQRPMAIPPSAYHVSGSTRIMSASNPDGRPYPGVTATPLGYYRIDSESLILWQLAAIPTGKDEERPVQYTWTIDEHTTTGREVLWLASHGPITFGLETRDAYGATRVSRTFPKYATPAPISLNKPEGRDQAFVALSNLIHSTQSAAATNLWVPARWSLLRAVTEPFSTNETQRLMVQTLAPKLPEQTATVRFAQAPFFFEILRTADPAAAQALAEKLAETDGKPDQTFPWFLAAAEVDMLDLNNLEAASRRIKALKTPAKSIMAPILLPIRQGDLELLAGNAKKAREYYDAAIEAWRTSKTFATRMKLSKPLTSWSSKTTRPRQKAPVTGAENLPLWRDLAARETSLESSALRFTEEKNFEEARAALDQWTTEYPSAKLDGGLLLAEARFQLAVGRPAIAARLLQAYRQAQAGLSARLIEAFDLEWDIREKMGDTQGSQALARDIIRTLPDHPLVQKANALLGGG